MILYDQTATASTNPQGLIQKAWYAYKGNTNNPVPGQSKYIGMVIAANRLKNDWATDQKIKWDSLFTVRTYGPIIATQQAYNIDSDIFYLSDWVYILRTDGNTDRFQVVHPEARNNQFAGIGTIGSNSGEPAVYLTGSSQNGGDNMVLNFVEPFQIIEGGTTQPNGDVGGTIQLGGYALPDDMVNPNDTVPVNDPEWLVAKLASELARNDPAKQDQYPNLIGEANDRYDNMVRGNQGNSFQQPNSPGYDLQQIGINWAQW